MKQTRTALHDWPRPKIKYELAMVGYTLADIGRELGYAKTSPYDVLRRPWVAMEQAVGKKLSLHPAVIWPTRYDSDTGLPLRSRAA